LATWRNGYAEDCKSLYPSSILGVASRHFKIINLFEKKIFEIFLKDFGTFV
jgi:hypothetical protein